MPNYSATMGYTRLGAFDRVIQNSTQFNLLLDEYQERFITEIDKWDVDSRIDYDFAAGSPEDSEWDTTIERIRGELFEGFAVHTDANFPDFPFYGADGTHRYLSVVNDYDCEFWDGLNLLINVAEHFPEFGRLVGVIGLGIVR